MNFDAVLYKEVARIILVTPRNEESSMPGYLNVTAGDFSQSATALSGIASDLRMNRVRDVHGHLSAGIPGGSAIGAVTAGTEKFNDYIRSLANDIDQTAGASSTAEGLFQDQDGASAIMFTPLNGPAGMTFE